MELQHVNVKIFLEGAGGVDPDRVAEVFHRWVAGQSMEELLVDVADYSHVHHGPGVLLVGLEADYSIDHTGGRSGLRYNRKAPLPGSNADRLRQALRAAARACGLLEAEWTDATGPRFSRTELEFLINDRALAPNSPESWTSLRAELEAVLAGVLGHREFRMERDEDPRRRLAATVKLARPFDLAAMQAA
jgi:hypothetical protein